MKRKNRKKREKKSHLVFTTTIVVFFSLIFSIIACCGLVFLFSLLNLRFVNNTFLFTLCLLGASAAIAFITFRIFISQFMTSEKGIRKLLNEIAKGNFNVQVPLTKSKYINKSIEDINTVLRELNSVKIMRTDFISDFSHEFKTPIVNINGFAELLLEGDLTEAERTEYTQIIYDESKRLSKLSQNVLLLNKLNSQAIVQDKTVYSLDEQLRKCISQFTREISEKKLQVELNAENVNFTGDADLLQQVWINLLSNAIKFSHPNGNIAVTLRREEKRATVEIADEGCGMDEETQKHVFDQFYQGDKSHKTEGNGLGLSIAKRITEVCGGSISVRSAPDRGTMFTVILPLEET